MIMVGRERHATFNPTQQEEWRQVTRAFSRDG